MLAQSSLQLCLRIFTFPHCDICRTCHTGRSKHAQHRLWMQQTLGRRFAQQEAILAIWVLLLMHRIVSFPHCDICKTCHSMSSKCAQHRWWGTHWAGGLHSREQVLSEYCHFYWSLCPTQDVDDMSREPKEDESPEMPHSNEDKAEEEVEIKVHRPFAFEDILSDLWTCKLRTTKACCRSYARRPQSCCKCYI